MDLFYYRKDPATLSDLDDLARHLRSFLNFAPIPMPGVPDDLVHFVVEEFEGLKIVMHHREHPPPHFHVECAEFEAKFAIANCELLAGRLRPREARKIREWHPGAYPKLVEEWNRSRPTGCSVGPIKP